MSMDQQRPRSRNRPHIRFLPASLLLVRSLWRLPFASTFALSQDLSKHRSRGNTWCRDSLVLGGFHFPPLFSSSASLRRSPAGRLSIGDKRSRDRPVPLTILNVPRWLPYPRHAGTTCLPRDCPRGRRYRLHTCPRFGNWRRLSLQLRSEDRSTGPADPYFAWMRFSCTSATPRWDSRTRLYHVRSFW